MALTLTYDHPDYEDGVEFGIAGLGVVKNRDSVEVTEEQELFFFATHSQTISDMLGKNENFTVSGTAIVAKPDAVEISDTPPADPTAMNIDPETGEVFAEANLQGKVSDPEFTPVEPVPPLDAEKDTTGVAQPVSPTTTVTDGGGEIT